MSDKWHGGKGSKRRPEDADKFSSNWDIIFGKAKRKNPMPANPCGECLYYSKLENITETLSEGWCRVTSPAGMVLSEETCEKWKPKD